jgi:nucleotide-binding universal stress UspA family protein
MPKNEPMENILVPTDFSKSAYHALKYAKGPFQNRTCNFFVVHVHTNTKRNKDSNILWENRKEKIKKRLQRTLRKIKMDEQDTEHTYTVISRKGEFITVVHALLEELHIDLIIMGNRGKKSKN